jgi:hypothetical protein
MRSANQIDDLSREHAVSISGKALKRLERRFDELCLCKDMLVVRPTEHIVRCFLFERTPYKGLFYFWRVVLPLYTPIRVLRLSYGGRLAKGEYIDLGESHFNESVQRLVEVISQGELADLRAIRRPEDFLARFGGPSSAEGITPRISAYDAALTFYLTGKTSLCVDILEDFAAEDMTRGSVDLRLSARDLAREMRVDPSAGERQIKALEKANIERYRLSPAIADGYSNHSLESKKTASK